MAPLPTTTQSIHRTLSRHQKRQIPTVSVTGRLRSEFDTLQLYDESGNPRARVPIRLGDSKGEAPGPIIEAYPEYGDGGAVQLHVDQKTLKYDQTEILPEE